jgi:hypothetical protein
MMLVTSVTFSAERRVSQQDLKEWAEIFSHPKVCAATARARKERFERRFPEAQRPVFFAAMWRYADKLPERDLIRSTVISGLADLQQWTPALQQIVALAAMDKNPDVRMMLLYVFHARGDAARTETLAFLEDEDEVIRSQAIRWMARWPDGNAILQQYVEKHPERTQSVAVARKILDYRAQHPSWNTQ